MGGVGGPVGGAAVMGEWAVMRGGRPLVGGRGTHKIPRTCVFISLSSFFLCYLSFLLSLSL